MNSVELSIFANRIDAVCEEMGAALQRAAFSPNIRDRQDYSCAVFDAEGQLCAQAAHIPVHLGSMAYAMSEIVSSIDWCNGDMMVLNDPYKGGTHLPDVTVIAPVFLEGVVQGFVANRAHHADIGSDIPGSMPLSTCLQDEGLIISPIRLVEKGSVNILLLDEILSNLRNPTESAGDFNAQIAANRLGQLRLVELISQTGAKKYQTALIALNDYAEQLAVSCFSDISDGEYCFSDLLDDDGLGNKNIVIKACIEVQSGKISVDFSGTAQQVAGNVNCPLSVTAAAVFYVFRCLLPAQAPACAGSFRSINIVAEKGCLLNACFPAAVAAGNVETSTRIVDVILGALADALPGKIPAASHGSMNNLAMGSTGQDGAQAWDYYETIGGGMGANAGSNGLDAVQTHMTNTLNTPVESLEMNYPLRVKRYQLRNDSRGKGFNSGGEGIIREYEFLSPAHITLLTERREHSPWGINKAGAGARGENLLNEKKLSAKASLDIKTADILIIKTPGGGGYNIK